MAAIIPGVTHTHGCSTSCPCENKLVFITLNSVAARPTSTAAIPEPERPNGSDGMDKYTKPTSTPASTTTMDYDQGSFFKFPLPPSLMVHRGKACTIKIQNAGVLFNDTFQDITTQLKVVTNLTTEGVNYDLPNYPNANFVNAPLFVHYKGALTSGPGFDIFESRDYTPEFRVQSLPDQLHLSLLRIGLECSSANTDGQTSINIFAPHHIYVTMQVTFD